MQELIILVLTGIAFFIFCQNFIDIFYLKKMYEIQRDRNKNYSFNNDLNSFLFLQQEEAIMFQAAKSTMIMLVMSAYVKGNIPLLNSILKKYENDMDVYYKTPTPIFNDNAPDLAKSASEFRSRTAIITTCSDSMIKMSRESIVTETEDKNKTYLN